MPHAGAAVWPRLQRVVRVLGACRWEYRPGSLRLPADEEEAPSTRQHAAAVDTARVAQGLVGIVVRLPAEELRRSGRERGGSACFGLGVRTLPGLRRRAKIALNLFSTIQMVCGFSWSLSERSRPAAVTKRGLAAAMQSQSAVETRSPCGGWPLAGGPRP